MRQKAAYEVRWYRALTDALFWKRASYFFPGGPIFPEEKQAYRAGQTKKAVFLGGWKTNRRSKGMKELAKTYDPKQMEDRIYADWLEKKYFHAEVDRSRKPFTIVMPPPNITGKLLEKEFGGNFDYMNRVFKKVTGETIFRYLNRVRINHAETLILNTPMKMSAIGSRVGFSDEYYFSRVFKKHTGKSPTEYAREGMNGRKAAGG